MARLLNKWQLIRGFRLIGIALPLLAGSWCYFVSYLTLPSLYQEHPEHSPRVCNRLIRSFEKKVSTFSFFGAFPALMTCTMVWEKQGKVFWAASAGLMLSAGIWSHAVMKSSVKPLLAIRKGQRPDPGEQMALIKEWDRQNRTRTFLLLSAGAADLWATAGFFPDWFLAVIPDALKTGPVTKNFGRRNAWKDMMWYNPRLRY